MWPFKKKEQHFNVGDLIKCIDDREWNDCNQSLSLTYGKTYKVLMVVECPVCHTFAYDIGSKFKNTKSFTRCSPHTHDLPAQGIHLAGHFRFAKSNEALLENTEELNLELEKAIKKENYLKAAELRDKLEKLVKV